MPKVTFNREPIGAVVEPPIGLNFGDIVTVEWEDGTERVYMVTVAPDTGGLKGNQALFTNLETGDIRSKNPINKDTITETQLLDRLKSKKFGAVESVDIMIDATLDISAQ